MHVFSWVVELCSILEVMRETALRNDLCESKKGKLDMIRKQLNVHLRREAK